MTAKNHDVNVQIITMNPCILAQYSYVNINTTGGVIVLLILQLRVNYKPT